MRRDYLGDLRLGVDGPTIKRAMAHHGHRIVRSAVIDGLMYELSELNGEMWDSGQYKYMD